MVETVSYIRIRARAGSGYQQYFVQGRNLRAETLYRADHRAGTHVPR